MAPGRLAPSPVVPGCSEAEPPPGVSVVVAVRDGIPWIRAQLAALLAQRCSQRFEVVVADNGSRDATRVVLSELAASDPRLRWIDASSRKGPGGARNAGVAAALGELILFCDADDVVAPGWLAEAVSALEEADVAAGSFDTWSLNGRRAGEPRLPATAQLGFLPAGLGANLAVRRRPFEAVGGFEEELVAGEDIDLCWRLQLGGFRFSYAPRAVVAKRERAGAGELLRQGIAHGRSGAALFRRHAAGGMRRQWKSSARGWAWLALSAPLLWRATLRRTWVRALGVRLGRLAGSWTEGKFFP